MIVCPLHSQVKKSHDIVVGFLQLKDGLNLGLVFNGAQLEYRYGLLWKMQSHEIQYQPKLGLGGGFSPKMGWTRRMGAIHIHFSPINATWTMPVYELNGHTMRAGANFTADYNYQRYDLHDSPLFWTSEIGLSPVIRYGYQWDDRRINVGLQNSLLGFVSHFQGYDPYYWQLLFSDFFVKPHTDMKFGSFNKYNHTNVSIEFVPNNLKKHSFLYEFDYLGFFYGNQFHRIFHNLIWRKSL
jgi:hypothetical protein